MARYPKSDGVLFKNNDKTAEKHPDWRGHLDVSKDQLKMLIQMAKAGQEIKLQIATWARQSKAGAPYFYVSSEAYMKDAAETVSHAAPAPAPEPQAESNDFFDDIPF